MKKTKIIYWIFTGFLALLMLFSGISNIMVTPESVTVFKHLGYPVYLIPFLGVAKTLGSLAIVVPGFARLKEWAYAGFVFDLAGAMYSGFSVGDPVSGWLPISVGFIIIAVSYIFYHRKQKEAVSN
ncbi:DoxX-like family protein [Pseudarcicella hirudinis]|uniref:DoxX-like family protein n=1 Tax=Pseudarcicella hirudinis TaxID=1079859 RepID=A0A1I5MS63_9BACT|nr:DoxX family protein [Pseudarcicella hirudinis]SFP12227.1 DoxX-like family protein [Pseudarcicella hirudinis]